MFRVGQKVVCVDDEPKGISNYRPAPPPYRPVRGRIYTIRDIDTRAADFHAGFPTIRVEEIQSPIESTVIGLWEPGFGPWRFRPIVEPKHETDISIFRKILDWETIPADEHVKRKRKVMP